MNTERRFLYTVGEVNRGAAGTHADFQTEYLASQYLTLLRRVDPDGVDAGRYYLDGPGEDDPVDMPTITELTDHEAALLIDYLDGKALMSDDTYKVIRRLRVASERFDGVQ